MKTVEMDIEKITKRLEEEGCRVLTEDELRLQVNGGWGRSSSSSSGSSSSRSGGSSSSRSSSSGRSSSRSSGGGNSSKRNSGSTETTKTKTSFGQKVSNAISSIKSWAQSHAPTNRMDKGYGSSGKKDNDTAGTLQQHASSADTAKNREVENTNHAVANARPGDTITRSNGTKVTLTQADINYAKAHDTEHRASATQVQSARSPANTTQTKDYAKPSTKQSSKTAKKNNAFAATKNTIRNTVSSYVHDGISACQTKVKNARKSLNSIKQKIERSTMPSQNVPETAAGIQETDLARIVQAKFDAVKGKPYGTDEIWGDDGVVSKDSKEMNCIGFVTYVYGKKCMHGVSEFDQYEGFYELTDITDVSQLKVGDVICWEGIEVDGDVNNHAQIWAGDGMVWESSPSKKHPERSCVRYETCGKSGADFYYNKYCIRQDSVNVRYFRPSSETLGM